MSARLARSLVRVEGHDAARLAVELGSVILSEIRHPHDSSHRVRGPSWLKEPFHRRTVG